MRILIIEDDLVARQHLARLLEPFGDCSMAVHGQQAVEAVRSALRNNEPYALMCMDINMPRVDGVACLEQIRELEKELGVTEDQRAKIVMTTAVPPRNALLDVMEGGKCDGYIYKPVRASKLHEHLRRLGLVAERPDA